MFFSFSSLFYLISWDCLIFSMVVGANYTNIVHYDPADRWEFYLSRYGYACLILFFFGLILSFKDILNFLTSAL